jgi:hypothetical protein
MKSCLEKVLMSMCSLLCSFGCSIYKVPEIGSAVSGPFALAGQPGTKNIFVINSSFSGEFRDGNILRYGLSADLKSLEKKEAYSVPRLGNDLAISPDGQVLVATFQGEEPKLKAFSLSKEGKLSEYEAEFNLEAGVTSQLQFFTPANPISGEYWLTAVQNPLGSNAKSFVFKILSESGKIKVSKVLTVPDDLPDGRPEDFKLGFGSPAYILKQDLMIFFPQGGSGAPPILPNPLELMMPNAKFVDSRHVSLVVVDFAAIRQGVTLEKSSAYLPLAFNAEGTTIDSSKTVKDAPNKDIYYRTGFTTSIGYAQTGCVTTSDAATDPLLPEDAVIVAEGTPSDYSTSDLEQVLSFSAFDQIAAELKSLAAFQGKEHSKRRLTNVPKIKVISRKKGVAEIDTEEGSYIRRIAVSEVGGSCLPVWLRSERSRAAYGEEVSRLSQNFNRDARKPLMFRFDARGSLTFGLLSVKGETPQMSRLFAFSPSFSYGNISAVEVKSNAFSPLN